MTDNMKIEINSQPDLLIMFMKNPVIGHVKSRLARDIGEMAAYQIYLDLISKTQQAVSDYPGAKSVFYADFINKNDNWPNDKYSKFLQQGNNIGECMNNSINQGLKLGYEKVVLIGSDIPNMDLSIINSAFQKLDDVDVVLGPSTDGGYYLIGLKSEYSDLFEDVPWSTKSVLSTTLKRCREKLRTTSLLPPLTDVDTIDDIYLLKNETRDFYLQIIKESEEKKMPA